MKVILIRHFKVDHVWKRYCTCNEFVGQMNQYNERPVIEPRELNFPATTVYISTLSRTAATAKYLTGQKNIIQTPLINEVDFSWKSSIPIRLPIYLWYLIVSYKWRTNSSRLNENEKATRKRALNFIRILEDKKEDCIVVSHGLFLRVLIDELARKGFKGGKRKSRHIQNGEVIEMYS